MNKVHYSDTQPIREALTTLFALDSTGGETAIELSILYMLHKAGLIEDGIHRVQLDAALEAFCETHVILAELYEKHIADQKPV